MKLDKLVKTGSIKRFYIDGYFYAMQEKYFAWVCGNYYAALDVCEICIPVSYPYEKYNSLRMYYEI